MKPLHVVLTLLLIALMACTAPEASRKSQDPPKDGLVFSHGGNYERGEPVKISVTNKRKDPLHLYKPRNIVIQKKGEAGWQKIRTLYCPCGASCPAPPESISLRPDSSFTYTWDQMEEWCGEMTKQGIPEMHRVFPGFGDYRLVVRILNRDTGQVKNHYQVFAITEQHK